MKNLLSLFLTFLLLYSCKKEGADNVVSLPAPTALPATSISYSMFAANWETSQSFDSIKLYAAKDSNFTLPVAKYNPATIVANSWGVDGLVPNTKYFYRVKSFLSGKSSAYSNIISTVTKNWDGQLIFGGNVNNIITHNTFSGVVKYVDLLVGTDIFNYSTRFSIVNAPTANSGTFAIKDAIVDAAGNGITDNITIGGILRIGTARYNSKAGGTITKTGSKSFTFSCPVYLHNDVNKVTVYTVTGNCIY